MKIDLSRTTKTLRYFPKKITTAKSIKVLEAEVVPTIPEDQGIAIEIMPKLEEVEVPATMLLVAKRLKFMSEASTDT